MVVREENADGGVGPNEFLRKPIRFIKEALCVPLLESNIKFDKLEIRCKQENIPSVLLEDLVTEPRVHIISNENT